MFYTCTPGYDGRLCFMSCTSSMGSWKMVKQTFLFARWFAKTNCHFADCIQSAHCFFLLPLLDIPWSEVKMNAVFPSGKSPLKSATVFAIPVSTSFRLSSNNLMWKRRHCWINIEHHWTFLMDFVITISQKVMNLHDLLCVWFMDMSSWN